MNCNNISSITETSEVCIFVEGNKLCYKGQSICDVFHEPGEELYLKGFPEDLCGTTWGNADSESFREIKTELHARLNKHMAVISKSPASSQLGKHALATGYRINTDAAK